MPRQRLNELRAGLAPPLTPFELRLDLPELWPPGLAALCPEVVPAALRQLHADLGQALLGPGLRTEARPYRPHLTLARHAASTRSPLTTAARLAGRTYALTVSTGQAGQRYEVPQRYGDAA